jgi:hypothetical protein
VAGAFFVAELTAPSAQARFPGESATRNATEAAAFMMI